MSSPSQGVTRMHKGLANWAVVAFILLHVAIVLPLAMFMPVWTDEVYTWNTASHGIVGAMRLGIAFERQAPLYFGIASIFRALVRQPEHLRLLSILCTTSMLVFVAAASRRIIPNRSPAWVIGLLGLHPLIIFAAVEARVYALASLMSALLIYLYLRVFSERPRWTGVVCFSAAAALSIYTQYYLVFILFALGCWTLLKRIRSVIQGYVLSMGLCFILALPIAFWLPSQLDAKDGIAPDYFTTSQTVSYFVALATRLSLPITRYFVDEARSHWPTLPLAACLQAVVVALLLTGAWLARRKAKSHFGETTQWWFVFLTMALLLSLVGKVAGQHLVSMPRYWIVLVVPAALALATLLNQFGTRGMAVMAVLILSHAFLAWQDNHALAKKGDAKRVAAYIQANEQKNQPIFVFPSRNAGSLQVYYRGSNRIAGLPTDESMEHWDIGEYRVQSEAAIGSRIEQVSADHTMLWLVTEPFTSAHFAIDTDFGQKLVQAYFDRHYRVEREQTFYQEFKVQRLIRLQGQSAAHE